MVLCRASLLMSTRTGPGRPGRGHVERLGQRARDLRRVGDEVVVLRDGHRDAPDVGLLEGVGADRLARHLAGDRDDGHRVHVGVGQRRDEVGRPRSRRRHADADATGRRRIPLGGVPGALLVAHEDVPHRGGVHQRVVGRQDRAAGDAEDGVDAEVLQRLDQGLRAGDLLGRRRGRLRRGARVRGRGAAGGPLGAWGTGREARCSAPARRAGRRAPRRRGRGWACWATSAGVGRTGVAPLLTGPLLSLGVVRPVSFAAHEKTLRSAGDRRAAR